MSHDKALYKSKYTLLYYFTSTRLRLSSRSGAAVRHQRVVSDVNARRHLRSASTRVLVVPRTRLFTVLDRALSVAAARIWTSLPDVATSCRSLPTFKRRLKTVLFARSYTNSFDRF